MLSVCGDGLCFTGLWGHTSVECNRNSGHRASAIVMIVQAQGEFQWLHLAEEEDRSDEPHCSMCSHAGHTMQRLVNKRQLREQHCSQAGLDVSTIWEQQMRRSFNFHPSQMKARVQL